MEVQALTRNARMSPKKVREVARTIQGRTANDAVEYLTLIPRKSARLIAKTLRARSRTPRTTTTSPPTP
jgi:large subunit ribosomal protein L22